MSLSFLHVARKRVSTGCNFCELTDLHDSPTQPAMIQLVTKRLDLNITLQPTIDPPNQSDNPSNRAPPFHRNHRLWILTVVSVTLPSRENQSLKRDTRLRPHARGNLQSSTVARHTLFLSPSCPFQSTASIGINRGQYLIVIHHILSRIWSWDQITITLVAKTKNVLLPRNWIQHYSLPISPASHK